MKHYLTLITWSLFLTFMSSIVLTKALSTLKLLQTHRQKHQTPPIIHFSFQTASLSSASRQSFITMSVFIFLLSYSLYFFSTYCRNHRWFFDRILECDSTCHHQYKYRHFNHTTHTKSQNVN